MRVARIVDGVVWEIADISVPISEAFPASMLWVEVGEDVQQSWVWDGAVFTPPAPTEVASREYPRFIGNEKLDLFTLAEQMAVAEAAATSPVVALTFYRMINAAYMSYEDPETEQGLGVLVGAGLLSLDRKTEIVASMQPK